MQRKNFIMSTGKISATTQSTSTIPIGMQKKKQIRHRYTLVGKSMLKDGPIDFGPKYRAQHAQKQFREGLEIACTTSEGELLVLSQMQKQLKLSRQLKKALGKEDAQNVFALAAYSVCTQAPLAYAASWLESHGLEQLEFHAPRISVLLTRISTEAQKQFFSSWLKQQAGGGALCYDITSLSSYGKNNDFIEYGYNRDREQLKQIHVALLSGKTAGLPIWHTSLAAYLL